MKKIILTSILLMPMAAVAYHSGGAERQGIGYIIAEAGVLLGMVVPVLITLALIYFIWGVIKYIKSGDNEEERKKAQSIILYGIIGLFAIVAVWGLVYVIANTFGISPGGYVDTPQSPQYYYGY